MKLITNIRINSIAVIVLVGVDTSVLWNMEELKKPVKVELHVIPINIQNMTEGEDSVDGCMETRKKEMLSRNKSAISSACLSRRSFPSRRCFTAVERPKRSRKSCQACAYHDVKQIEQDMEVEMHLYFDWKILASRMDSQIWYVYLIFRYQIYIEKNSLVGHFHNQSNNLITMNDIPPNK